MADSNPAEEEAISADDMLEMMEVDGAIGGEDSFEEKKKTLEELERAEVKVVEDMAVMKCLGCGFAWIEHLNHSRWIKVSFTLHNVPIQECDLPTDTLQEGVVQVLVMYWQALFN